MNSKPQDAQEIPKRVEEALFHRLKQRGFRECDEKVEAYADCCRGRVASIAWACRQEAKAMSNCMSKYTGKLDMLKQRWAEKGSKLPLGEREWDLLLDEVLLD